MQRRVSGSSDNTHNPYENRRERYEAEESGSSKNDEELARSLAEERAERASLDAIAPTADDIGTKAKSWDGLERIGHLGRWLDYPPTEADKLVP